MANNKRLVAEISLGNEIIMNVDDNILNAEFGALDRGNLTDVVDWGIYANRGSLSFIDNIGYFSNENINSTEIKNAIVRFYIEKNSKSLVSTFGIESISFDDETRKVDVELISTLMPFQNQKSKNSIYPFEQTTVSSLLDQVGEEFDKMISFGADSYNIAHTYIYCPYFPSGDTLWDILTKICQATMTRVAEDEYGRPIISGSFPKKNRAIIVNPNNIISIEKGGAISLPNISIGITDRKRYYQTQLDDASRTFYISYDENGNPIENNGDYTFRGEGSVIDIEISSSVTTHNPLRGTDYGFATNTDTVERILPRGGDEPVSGGEYSRTYTLKPNVIKDNKVILQFASNAVTNIGGILHRLTSVQVVYKCDYFEDYDSITQTIADDYSQPIFQISTNDLVQTSSICENNGVQVSLADHILNESHKRYSNGIECFEIECLFNNYYYEDGELAIDKYNVNQRLSRYDLIIPYVMKRGQRVPLRVNQDGTPKKFRVIGISYSYDGLLRQKLYVQEERYDV